MHLYETMKNFLMDCSYSIDFFENCIHVFNYIDILKLNEKEIALQMSKFQLVLTGNHFVVKQLEKREILIEGEIDEVRFLR